MMGDRPTGDKRKRDTGDIPDFDEADIKLADSIWDRIGKAETTDRIHEHISKSMAGRKKPTN